MQEKMEIKVIFDPETQNIGIEFDTAKFKTWGLIIGVLTSALESAKNTMHMQQIQMAQMRAMEAAQNQRIANSIIQGR